MLSPGLFDVVKAIVARKQEVQDEDFEIAIDKADINIGRYCKLRVLPLEMKYIIADMVLDIIKMDTYVAPSEENDDFSSRITKLTQGDTTIELETEKQDAPYSSMRELMGAYKEDLASFRGVYWR